MLLHELRCRLSAGVVNIFIYILLLLAWQQNRKDTIANKTYFNYELQKSTNSKLNLIHLHLNKKCRGLKMISAERCQVSSCLLSPRSSESHSSNSHFQSP